MNTQLAEQFGGNLRRCRRRAGLSQQALADLAELNRVAVSAMERGLRLPRLDTILKVSAGVDASPCHLLEGLHWLPGHQVEGDFRIEDGSEWASRAEKARP